MWDLHVLDHMAVRWTGSFTVPLQVPLELEPDRQQRKGGCLENWERQQKGGLLLKSTVAGGGKKGYLLRRPDRAGFNSCPVTHEISHNVTANAWSSARQLDDTSIHAGCMRGRCPIVPDQGGAGSPRQAGCVESHQLRPLRLASSFAPRRSDGSRRGVYYRARRTACAICFDWTWQTSFATAYRLCCNGRSGPVRCRPR